MKIKTIKRQKVLEKNKIDTLTAEKEFERFAESMDLDIDTNSMDDDDKQSFNQQKKRIVNAIMKGSLVVSDAGEPVFTPQAAGKDVNAITFYEPTGASLMAMDRKGRTEDIKKLYSVMADVTGTSAGIFSKMKMRDLKVCQAIITLFLA